MTYYPLISCSIRGIVFVTNVTYFIISENHKGTMSVESFTGKGTKFVIRLPMD